MFLFIISRPEDHKPFTEYVCRGCGQTVAKGEDLLPKLNDSVLNTFINPAGVECQVLTFRKASRLKYFEWATEEHTWFDGYAWRVAQCDRCTIHLGWRFEASNPESAASGFHGLLLLHLKGIP
ncbi:cereblon family protein [Acidobacteriota bacterium]